MADIVQRLEHLSRLNQSIHWFCPRSNPNDTEVFFDEDCLDDLPTESKWEKDARLAKVGEAERRRNDFLYACRIMAFDGADAAPYIKKLTDDLQRQLVRCDICIREFHRSRNLLKQLLEADFDEEDVQAFMKRYDAFNVERIAKGLDKMTESLVDLPPEQRNIMAAGNEGTYAMFEALNCEAFLSDETALQEHFDKPFKLVQTNKKLKLPTCTPGMVAFLFSSNRERSVWAYRNFAAIKQPLVGKVFEHSVKPFLERGMARVVIGFIDKDFLPPFWKAARLILTKMTKNLIANHVRVMDSNLFTLALDQFQIDDDHFYDMVMSYQMLLELAPATFWDAMGGINAQTVAETIFKSPVLQRDLQVTDEHEPLHLNDKLGWCLPFVNSIKPAQLVPPVRSMLDQLLTKCQEPPYSKHAGSVCWETGLVCMLVTIKGMLNLPGGPIVIHMLEVVAKDHFQHIMDELAGVELKEEWQIDKTEQLDLEIVESTLALDVHSLTHDRNVIHGTTSLDHEIGMTGQDVWKFAMRSIKPGHAALPTAILFGIKSLLPLEKFTPRQIEKASKHAENWNFALNRTLDYVQTDLLERLEAFTPDQLIELYQEVKAAKGLMTLLFSGEQTIHSGTLNILKILSGEDNRRDSLMHVVKAFFTTTLTSVASTQHDIATSKTFAPNPTLLKLSMDFFSCLCDSRDGVLRSRTFAKSDELAALGVLWEKTWMALSNIFDETEPWSNRGHDKSIMTDFCRATMDFADYVFDQYSIIANTIQEGATSSATDTGRALLRFPAKAFGKIIKWLRLRDEYLISKAVSLTCKMLMRLQEVNIEIDSSAAQWVEDVVTGVGKNAKVKTNLGMNQKAELQRALETHLGVVPIFSGDDDVVLIATPKRQSSLTNWTQGRTAATTKPRDGAAVVDVTSTAEKARKQVQDEHDEAYKSLIASATAGSDAFKKMQTQKPKALPTPATVRATQKHQEDQKKFLLKRKQEKEAAAKLKAEYMAKQKLGAGSGVAGLGDMGKDHTLKGQNVMVSSDEESEDDDDDDVDNELFGGKVKERRKIERPNVDPNGAIGLKPDVKKGPVRIQRTARTMKDMRARLAPDLAPLHKIILKWDFFADGDYPPDANMNLFRGVANSFTDPTTYQETFEPLLTLEAWQGMVRARDENQAAKPYEVKVQNRSNVDSFIEISSLVGHAENRELSLQEGDIILLSKAQKPMADPAAPHCLARIYRIKRQKTNLELVYQIMAGTSLLPFLVMQAVVYGVKVHSITPLEREYGALQGLQYYDLCQHIIKAAPSRKYNFSEKQINSVRDNWGVNPAQAQAINAALENEGFSLIQGPPGSGKTKTIVAIVGGILTPTLAAGASGGTRISVPKGRDARNSSSAAPSKKLLVCAPSNAAVDELVIRLKQGVKTKTHNELKQINVVRIGRSDAINAQVIDVTMEELVGKRLGNNDSNEELRRQNTEIFKEHENVSGILRDLYGKKDSGNLKGKELTALEQEITHTRRRKNELGVRIDNVKDQERNVSREHELNRKRAQQAVLDDAHVICATLSGSGHDMFRSLNIEFETVIIDEAAQCVEMSSLIPLKYGCVKCIMVGDPKQLPPTVFSKEAAKFQYEQSLFVRMQNNFADEVYLLDTQYRMHPEISVFPSRTFYDGLLKDGANMAALRKQEWHSSALLAPYRFFNVQGQHQATGIGSLTNRAEAEVALALYARLTTDYKNYNFARQIGIITPYRAQLKELKAKFSARYGNGIFDIVEFNTTDAFQGRESEVIIFSCVRASPTGGIGFLQDIRRMNVGLTRAKSSLWVLGNAESLVRGQFWKKLVEDAQSRDCFTSGNLVNMLSKPSSAFPANMMRTASMVDANTHISRTKHVGANGSAGAAEEVHPSRTAAADSRALDRAPQVPAGQDSERMEGVRYRFEDRIAGKKRPAGSESNIKHPLQRSSDSHDVEMRDATTEAKMHSIRSDGGTTAPPTDSAASLDGIRPSGNPPLATNGNGDHGTGDQANGSAKPKQSGTQPVAAQKVFVKRPAASPFMPKPRKR